MAKTIDYNTSSLESNIKKLKSLKQQIKKPKISFFNDRTTSYNSGDGYALDMLYKMAFRTEDYYKALNLLVDNTVKYLESAKESIESTDVSIANTIQGEK